MAIIKRGDLIEEVTEEILEENIIIEVAIKTTKIPMVKINITSTIDIKIKREEIINLSKETTKQKIIRIQINQINKMINKNSNQAQTIDQEEEVVLDTMTEMMIPIIINKITILIMIDRIEIQNHKLIMINPLLIKKNKSLTAIRSSKKTPQSQRKKLKGLQRRKRNQLLLLNKRSSKLI
jgi:hypothetical protein